MNKLLWEMIYRIQEVTLVQKLIFPETLVIHRLGLQVPKE